MKNVNVSVETLLSILGQQATSTVCNEQGQNCSSDNGDWKIVVLQRGWVAVGRYFRHGTECRLEDASTIRRWGTTKGLGELALNGPLKDTKLDKSGTIRFHLGAEVCRMDCKTTNWN